MHELPIVTSILDLALKSTPAGARVLRVELSIGALCDAEGSWLQRYFRLAARGTACEGAELSIERKEASFRCPACGLVFPLAASGLRAAIAEGPPCPGCGSRGCAIVGGIEYRLERIEVQEARAR